MSVRWRRFDIGILPRMGQQKPAQRKARHRAPHWVTGHNRRGCLERATEPWSRQLDLKLETNSPRFRYLRPQNLPVPLQGTPYRRWRLTQGGARGRACRWADIRRPILGEECFHVVCAGQCRVRLSRYLETRIRREPSLSGRIVPQHFAPNGAVETSPAASSSPSAALGHEPQSNGLP